MSFPSAIGQAKRINSITKFVLLNGVYSYED